MDTISEILKEGEVLTAFEIDEKGKELIEAAFEKAEEVLKLKNVTQEQLNQLITI